MMRISIFGLGYVGCVSAACFASDGHTVIGVDINPTKVNIISSGHSPIVEPRLDDLISENVFAGRLKATTDAVWAIGATDLSFVCVGTPSAPNGSLDFGYVKRITADIGIALRLKKNHHTVVFRSTMVPGSMERVVIPVLEETSGLRTGQDFGLAYNPEFLREGTAIDDFRNPPRTVIGEMDPQSGEQVANLYTSITAPMIRTNFRTAEMVKYADNAFHGLKIGFANEMGALCRELGVDSYGLMDIFCLDTKLNLSPAYLKPGFAFGGSCLPKDLRAITYLARSLDVSVPILEAILTSNQEHKRRALDLVMAQGKKKIGVLGLSFKEDTDDLRESPTVGLLEQLIGKGYSVCVYDRNVSLARLMGANKAYIERELPHIATLMVPEMTTLLEQSEVIVVTNRSSEFQGVASCLRPDQDLVDLVHLLDNRSGLNDRYSTLVG